jgi:outer membrane cobalamin receptor
MYLNVRSILITVVVVLTAICLGTAPAQGADTVDALLNLTLEDLMGIEVKTVSGASRFEQKETEAPANVTVITADDIKQYGYRTLAEILQRVTGLYTSYDRNYAYLGVRGFMRPGDYNTRFLLLVDGLRMNDNIYGSASIGTEFILDVDLIDRVETILGPSSSLYGSSAFLGIINIITRPAGSFGGVELSGEGGELRYLQGEGQLRTAIQEWIGAGHVGVHIAESRPDAFFQGICVSGDELWQGRQLRLRPVFELLRKHPVQGVHPSGSNGLTGKGDSHRLL